MRNVQISQELFMQLLRFHLIEDESCEKEIKKELEKNWTRWSCVTCLENQKLHRQRKNGNGQEKNIWTDVELTKAEEKTLIWLAGWEESTVDNLLSVIEKQPGYGQRKGRIRP